MSSTWRKPRKPVSLREFLKGCKAGDMVRLSRVDVLGEVELVDYLIGDINLLGGMCECCGDQGSLVVAVKKRS